MLKSWEGLAFSDNCGYSLILQNWTNVSVPKVSFCVESKPYLYVFHTVLLHYNLLDLVFQMDLLSRIGHWKILVHRVMPVF